MGAVAYLKLTDGDGLSKVGFFLGKARLAPKPDITILRLELCAAVLAIEVAELLLLELDITTDQVHFYTDSKVVIGYIFNKKRCFYVYVHNRVERIRPLNSLPTPHGSVDPLSSLVQTRLNYRHAI